MLTVLQTQLAVPLCACFVTQMDLILAWLIPKTDRPQQSAFDARLIGNLPPDASTLGCERLAITNAHGDFCSSQ